MQIYSLFLVGIGGFFGSIARYATARSIDVKLKAQRVIPVRHVDCEYHWFIYSRHRDRLGVQERCWF
jgi:hypothetical protein